VKEYVAIKGVGVGEGLCCVSGGNSPRRCLDETLIILLNIHKTNLKITSVDLYSVLEIQNGTTSHP